MEEKKFRLTAVRLTHDYIGRVKVLIKAIEEKLGEEITLNDIALSEENQKTLLTYPDEEIVSYLVDFVRKNREEINRNESFVLSQISKMLLHYSAKGILHKTNLLKAIDFLGKSKNPFLNKQFVKKMNENIHPNSNYVLNSDVFYMKLKGDKKTLQVIINEGFESKYSKLSDITKIAIKDLMKITKDTIQNPFGLQLLIQNIKVLLTNWTDTEIKQLIEKLKGDK